MTDTERLVELKHVVREYLRLLDPANLAEHCEAFFLRGRLEKLVAVATEARPAYPERGE